MNKLNFIVKVSICLKTLNSILNIWCCYVLIYKLSNLLMLKTVSQRSRINPFHKFLIMTSSIALLGTSKFLEHSRRAYVVVVVMVVVVLLLVVEVCVCGVHA